MGKLATFIVALIIGCTVTSRAADFLLVNNQFTHVYTNTISYSSNTNGVNITNTQPTAGSIYHTFDFSLASVNTNAIGTNTLTMAIDRTLDGTNWYIITTNTYSAYGVNETNFTGKWGAYRFRTLFQNTNAIGFTISYMAQ